MPSLSSTVFALSYWLPKGTPVEALEQRGATGHFLHVGEFPGKFIMFVTGMPHDSMWSNWEVNLGSSVIRLHDYMTAPRSYLPDAGISFPVDLCPTVT